MNIPAKNNSAQSLSQSNTNNPTSDTPDFSKSYPSSAAPADAKPETSCGAVIVHNHKILIVHQQNGLSGFPKGHIEPGETELETARREIKEETDLDIILDPATRYAFSYYIPRLNIIKTVVLFLAKLKDPSQIAKEQPSEISQLEWLPLDQIEPTLNFPEWQNAWRTFRTKHLAS